MDMKLLAKLFGAFAAAVIAHEIINMRRSIQWEAQQSTKARRTTRTR